MRKSGHVLGLAAGAIFASAGYAQTVDNSTVTIVNNAPAFSGDFAVSNVLDAGANTDFASSGQGVNTFIDFDFGSAQTFTGITFTDRVTSGGGNGAFVGGTSEQNTAFDFIFSQNSTFGDADDVTVTGIAPADIAGRNATSDAELTSTTPIANVMAQFVRFDVTAVEGNTGAVGPNNGASNFVFSVVPEPASLSLLGLGGLGLLARRRRAA